MYEKFYRLTAAPFQLGPDPYFFFPSAGHKRALTYLRYGIKQGEGFIIITGNVGTGKSTLIGMLLKMLEKEDVVACQLVTTQMGSDDMLRMIAAGFGLPYQRVTKAGLIKGIEDYCRGCVGEGKRALLIVDEAQGLAPRAIEELRMLSNFQANGKPLLQSFLLGQREFRVTMRSKGFEQLRQRVIAAHHLKPLDATATRDYVVHRLTKAGWQEDPVFTPAVFDGIHQFTEGVPRRINTLCDRLLLFGYMEGLHEIDTEALTAVTTDIIEEHGLAIDDVSGVVPEGAPTLAIPGARAADGGTHTATDAADQRRIESVEESVARLTSAFQQEMSLIRATLTAGTAPRTPAGEGSEDDR